METKLCRIGQHITHMLAVEDKMFWKRSPFLIHYILDALTCLLKCVAPFLLSFWSYLMIMIINATVKVSRVTI